MILKEDFETLQEGGTGDLPGLQLAGVHVNDLPHGQTVIQLREQQNSPETAERNKIVKT